MTLRYDKSSSQGFVLSKFLTERGEPLGEVVEPRPQLFSKAEWLESATIGDAIVASG